MELSVETMVPSVEALALSGEWHRENHSKVWVALLSWETTGSPSRASGLRESADVGLIFVLGCVLVHVPGLNRVGHLLQLCLVHDVNRLTVG